MIYGSGDNEISDGTPPIEGSEGRGERSTVNGDEVTGGWWTWLEGRVGARRAGAVDKLGTVHCRFIPGFTPLTES
jgi:hypothetical protein